MAACDRNGQGGLTSLRHPLSGFPVTYSMWDEKTIKRGHYVLHHAELVQLGAVMPPQLLRDLHAPRDLTVAFPVGFLVGDHRVVWRWLDGTGRIYRTRCNRVLTGCR